MKSREEYNILVVDDEPEIREILADHFRLDGYNVLTAGGGEEALELVKKQNIDFIITDIRMHKGDGEELLVKVRELDPKFPVIVMVTGFSELTREKAIEKGALDLLHKPINMDQIERYVEEARTKT